MHTAVNLKEQFWPVFGNALSPTIAGELRRSHYPRIVIPVFQRALTNLLSSALFLSSFTTALLTQTPAFAPTASMTRTLSPLSRRTRRQMLRAGSAVRRAKTQWYVGSTI